MHRYRFIECFLVQDFRASEYLTDPFRCDAFVVVQQDLGHTPWVLDPHAAVAIGASRIAKQTTVVCVVHGIGILVRNLELEITLNAVLALRLREFALADVHRPPVDVFVVAAQRTAVHTKIVALHHR